MRSKTVCFTGHRELPADDLPEISKHLEDTLATLIEQGYRYFGAGGALGFDTLAAQVVLRLRERYPRIRRSLGRKRISTLTKRSSAAQIR